MYVEGIIVRSTKWRVSTNKSSANPLQIQGTRGGANTGGGKNRPGVEYILTHVPHSTVMEYVLTHVPHSTVHDLPRAVMARGTRRQRRLLRCCVYGSGRGWETRTTRSPATARTHKVNRSTCIVLFWVFTLPQSTPLSKLIHSFHNFVTWIIANCSYEQIPATKQRAASRFSRPQSREGCFHV